MPKHVRTICSLAFAVFLAFALVVHVPVLQEHSSGNPDAPACAPVASPSRGEGAVDGPDASVGAGGEDTETSDLSELSALDEGAAKLLESYFASRGAQLAGGGEADGVALGDGVAAAHALRAQGLASMAAQAGFAVLDATATVVAEQVERCEGGIAVTAYERTRFTYDDLGDGVGGSDVAVFGTVHEVMLACGEGGYRIASDFYDELDVSGVDTTDADLEADPPAMTFAADALGVQQAYAASSPTYSASYNTEKAIMYSDQYALSYNSSYRNYNPVGGDCANFVSQCMNAGAFGQVVGKYNSASSWYYKSGSDYSESWTYCPTMVSCFKKRGKYVDVTKNNATSAAAIFPGSPVIYKSSTEWSHATFCVGYNSAGTPVINAHNSDRYHMPYTYWTPKGRCTVQLTKTNAYGRTFTTGAGGQGLSTASTDSTFTWMTTSSTTVALKSYVGTASTVSIGTSVVGADDKSYTITRIGSNALSGAGNAGNKRLKALYVGDKVTRIDESACENCTALSSVTFGSKVTTVCSRAFRGCAALTSVAGTSGLKYLQAQVFYGCRSMKSLPSCPKLKSVGSSAFRNCSSLAAVPTLPKLKTVASSAFRGCGKLAKVAAQPKLKTVGASAFRACSSLSAVPKMAALVTVKKLAFSGCSKLETAKFGSKKLSSIGASAFEACPTLKTLTLSSKKLSSIGKRALYGCSSLKTLTVKSKLIRKKSKVGARAFSGVNAHVTVKVPASKLKSYRTWFKARGMSGKAVFAKL